MFIENYLFKKKKKKMEKQLNKTISMTAYIRYIFVCSYLHTLLSFAKFYSKICKEDYRFIICLLILIYEFKINSLCQVMQCLKLSYNLFADINHGM